MNSPRIQDLPFYRRSGLHLILTIGIISPRENIIGIGVMGLHIIAIEVNVTLLFLFKGNHQPLIKGSMWVPGVYLIQVVRILMVLDRLSKEGLTIFSKRVAEIGLRGSQLIIIV
jgi:hypothetical protein